MSLSKILRGLVLLSVVAGALYATSLQYIEEFPKTSEMVPILQNEPEQGPIELDPFLFEYRDHEYIVKPLHTYEIWGLVVSHNNTAGIGDMYHDSDSVDFKDLCLVWGENTDKSILERVHFWSEPWSCHMRWKDREVGELFNQDQLSNTHILSRRDEVRELIQNMKVGDQVQLKGMLVGYADKHYPSAMRTSSVVRTDKGNGACEVMFVEAAKIIKAANTGWRMIHGLSKSILWLLAFLIPVLWITNAQIQFQRMKAEVRRRQMKIRGRKALTKTHLKSEAPRH